MIQQVIEHSSREAHYIEMSRFRMFSSANQALNQGTEVF
jgi:hypothetical protein